MGKEKVKCIYSQTTAIEYKPFYVYYMNNCKTELNIYERFLKHRPHSETLFV